MKKREPKHPTRCLVRVNVSHAADKILRRSELTRVGTVCSRELHEEHAPTHLIGCLICSVRF